jgi:hypothetical protein
VLQEVILAIAPDGRILMGPPAKGGVGEGKNAGAVAGAVHVTFESEMAALERVTRRRSLGASHLKLHFEGVRPFEGARQVEIFSDQSDQIVEVLSGVHARTHPPEA